MAKSSGGVRNVPKDSVAFSNRIAEVVQMKASGEYSSVKMYNSGWVAIEKSPTRHKSEEIEAASILASHGYKVTLTDESGKGKAKQGKKNEGRLFIHKFEQKTPPKEGHNHDAANFKNALNHARDKKADIAVVYMKHGKHPRTAVEQGIKDFERFSKYRFKKIIVITKDGRLHYHVHN